MIVELERRFDDDGFSLWGFDRPTEHWLMPELMLIASENAFERWMFDTDVTEFPETGEPLSKWLEHWADSKRTVAELQTDIPMDKPFFEFGRLVYYDLAGRLEVPGVHYIGRIRLKPFEELLKN